MRISYFVIIALIISAPAIANNNLPPGTILNGTSGELISTTVGATGQFLENNTYGLPLLNTMWYSWTAPTSGVFTAATCNLTTENTTNFDTTLVAYSSSGFPLLVQSTNDDAGLCMNAAGNQYSSTVTFNAVAGTTYHLQVDGYDGLTGNFVLRWGLVGIVLNTVTGNATEGGTSGSLNVQLRSPPAIAPPGSSITFSQPVTVNLTAGPQCSLSPTVLNFDSTNWKLPQTVTVTAIDDVQVEGNHSCSPASVTASGGSYDGVFASSIPSFTVTDNDIAALALNKTWSFALNGDVDGDGSVDKGDTIKFTFTSLNSGTVPLSNVIVTETAFDGSGPQPVPIQESIIDTAPLGDSTDSVSNNGIWSTLGPGDSVVMTANYTVTQTDIDLQ